MSVGQDGEPDLVHTTGSLLPGLFDHRLIALHVDSFILQNSNFNSPILGATFGSLVIGDGLTFTKSEGLH